MKRIVFAVLGYICFGLGTAGVVLPILPTAPFYLLTLFFFTNSSEKLHTWFLGTKLYKKHLDSFVKKKGMLLKTKLCVIATVTLLMGFGFFMMARKEIWIPCIILAIVWIFHLIYFVFFVKTISREESEAMEQRDDSLKLDEAV